MVYHYSREWSFVFIEKRTGDNIVTGSIKLNVSCVVAGEFHIASFHQMYTLIHEVC